MKRESPIGVLLVQLGTPDSTEVADVRRYLREFLSDPRVLDVPAPVRWGLLNLVILPFRPRRSAEAYEKIWTEEGSPLTIHTEALAREVAARLGPDYVVEVGMRYQNPPIEAAVAQLVNRGVRRIVVVPLFPQYSSAASGSALERTLELVGSQWNVPGVTTVVDFFDDDDFINSVAEVARPLLAGFVYDHVLFSYHGLPEKQVKKSDPSQSWCLQVETCCDQITDVNRFCYRAQSFATTRRLAAALGLEEERYSTSFQSRLAGQRWIRPFTDKVLGELASNGVRRLAVLTPSFTADCLETLEEIGIRARQQWEDLGGSELLLIPCVNAAPAWSDAVASMVRRAG